MAAPLIQKHLKAIELRKEGKSYSQIKKELQVSKSSLSLWLRDYPLPHEILVQLRDRNERRIENFRNTWKKKKEECTKEIHLEELARLTPLSERELYIAGLFLYWGEGVKASSHMVSVTNSDPRVMKFFVYWLINVLKFPKDKLRARLHLYKDMDVAVETEFWSRELGLPLQQFNKPYIKETTLKSLTYKSFGHGTCDVSVGGAEMHERIMEGIKAISDYCTSRT